MTAVAAATRRPKAAYVREALEHEIARIEWEQGILRQGEDYRAGRLETFSEAEVIEHLGLDG